MTGEVVVLGAKSSGKSSLIRWLAGKEFSSQHAGTDSVTRREMSFNFSEDTYQFYDCPANQFLAGLIKDYCLRATAALIVFDASQIEREEEQQKLHFWFDFVQKNNPGASVILVANKTDLLKKSKFDPRVVEAICDGEIESIVETSVAEDVNLHWLQRMLKRVLLPRELQSDFDASSHAPSVNESVVSFSVAPDELDGARKVALQAILGRYSSKVSTGHYHQSHSFFKFGPHKEKVRLVYNRLKKSKEEGGFESYIEARAALRALPTDGCLEKLLQELDTKFPVEELASPPTP